MYLIACVLNKCLYFYFSGHVFPEFKESDAMFAAERVRYFVLPDLLK